jgi:hypothetical protein
MMRGQELGRRYLAGFVIASAGVYIVATSIVSVMAWRDTYPLWLATNWFALALIPAATAIALGMRAWATASVALSALALVILLIALVLWQLFVVSF